MASRMESKFTPEQQAIVNRVLVAQTASIGMVESPTIEELLSRHECRSVLDIGCGEGTFLLHVARRLPRMSFVGIDHSELAINDAVRKLRRSGLRNIQFRVAFFNENLERTKYDAIMTRYTLQHSSEPETFVKSVFARLKKGGVFVAMESIDAFTGSAVPDEVWDRFRTAIAAVHKKLGSNDNIGKSLGLLYRKAGLREIGVRVVLCSPSTVGVRRFQGVIRASAALAFAFFPELFDKHLHEEVKGWVADRNRLEQTDPCLCSAIGTGIKP